MANSPDKNSVAEALDCLRSCNHFFEFDNQERIVHVAVYNAENADEIAAHVGSLVDVENLTFSRTDLTDQGLNHWHGLVRLRELWIGGSGVTAAGLTCLNAMTQLDDLYIEDASHLDGAAFERIAAATSLRRLSVKAGHYHDDDLKSLANSKNLEELSLSENDQITGAFCRYLAALPRLRELSPGEHVRDEGIAQIATLPYLEKLFLEGPFTDEGLSHIRALKRLKTLYLTSQQFTTAGLAVVAELPELTDLCLHCAFSQDSSVPVLARCKSLRWVTFFESTLSDEGRRQLLRALPECEIFEPGR
jgi:hypothetical protein